MLHSRTQPFNIFGCSMEIGQTNHLARVEQRLNLIFSGIVVVIHWIKHITLYLSNCSNPTEHLIYRIVCSNSWLLECSKIKLIGSNWALFLQAKRRSFRHSSASSTSTHLSCLSYREDCIACASYALANGYFCSVQSNWSGAVSIFMNP